MLFTGLLSGFLSLAPIPALAGSGPSAATALSQLSQALGWNQHRYYSTIQTAAIDGDGQSNVLARWIDGLNVFRFENGTLIRHSRIAALSDNAGFHEPSWYGTIRAAVLEPKLGRADVVARKSDGVHVFRYNRIDGLWQELGANAAVRPFPDVGPDGTDWTQPKHYSTLQLVDVTGDGAAELVGRGRYGMQVFRWVPATETWEQISDDRALADNEGFKDESYYSSIRLIDLDGDGVAELIARAPGGMRMYKWTGSGWVIRAADGPFADDPALVASKRYKSIGTHVDARGVAWLYGVVTGSGGAGSGAIAVHRWLNDRWRLAQTIPLPGTGWDRESQFSTLMAADIAGDANPEFMIRGPLGLHAFTSNGQALPMHTQSFSDAQGWNRIEQFGTLRTATARLAGSASGGYGTLVIGRGSKGLEAYRLAGQWVAAADPGFPQWCTNFDTGAGADRSPHCQAYQSISRFLDPRYNDIRTQYTQAGYKFDTFERWYSTAYAMSNPNGKDTDPAWVAVKGEMVQELAYVATVKLWFQNTRALMDLQYKDASGLLDQAVTDVDLATSTSVVAKWVELAGLVASAVASAVDGGASAAAFIAILSEVYGALMDGSGGDVSQQISVMRTELNMQVSGYPGVLAKQELAYLSDYAKLQQISADSKAGGFNWASATDADIANAAASAREAMLLNFYKTLLPAKWQVYWCSYPGTCRSAYTQYIYDCEFGPPELAYSYSDAAYVYAGETVYVNWALLDKLTGRKTAAQPDNMDAIWYMMLLGGDLGWDLPQYGLPSFNDNPYVNYPDPLLAYDSIKKGYPGNYYAKGCNGNGSTTGQLVNRQSVSQRLSVAQHNGRRVTASEAPGIVEEIRLLSVAATTSPLYGTLKADLDSPLREAALLIQRANAAPVGRFEPSASATTATHLTELFIRRVQANADALGEARSQQLAAHAHCLVGRMQGQVPAGQMCPTEYVSARR